MEPLALSFSAALLMGLAFGAGPCNVTCLPYLGPVFLGNGRGARGGWRIVLPFSLGRLSGYAALGAVAGAFGYAATATLEEGTATLLLGIATMVLGLMMWRRAGRGRCSLKSQGAVTEVALPIAPAGKQLNAAAMPMGLFGMGAAMALNPCVPLGTVLLAAAASGKAGEGLLLGSAFGLGAVVIPALVFGLLVAHFGEQVRMHLQRQQRRLEQGAALLLVLLGWITAMGWVQP